MQPSGCQPNIIAVVAAVQPLSSQLRPTHETHRGSLTLSLLPARNEEGSLWASAVWGQPGFLDASDPARLIVEPLDCVPGDPCQLTPGTLLGSTAIDLQTRTRCRQNGTIAACSARLEVDLDVSFSSCPKFIQSRQVKLRDDAGVVGNRNSRQAHAQQGGPALGEPQRAMLRRCDTFFLASCAMEESLVSPGGSKGCDISHRGGDPGFIQVQDSGVLTWADYIGNMTFTTLGNLHVDPRAAIVAIDYSTGDVLQLSGSCQILWDQHDLPGAERTLQFATQAWNWAPGGIPVTTSGEPVKPSPYNPPVGAWQPNKDVVKDRVALLDANFIQPPSKDNVLSCLDTWLEAPNVRTYVFEAPGQGLKYRAGQYAMFAFSEAQMKAALASTPASTPPSPPPADAAANVVPTNPFAPSPDAPPNPPTQIRPHLFLGSYTQAWDAELLRARKITAIFNVTVDIPQLQGDAGFASQRIPVWDLEGQTLVPYFGAFCAAVRAARARGEAVLVHCLAGISRSPTLVLAYLMVDEGLSLEAAFAEVNAKRRIAPKFTSQLKLLEAALAAHPHQIPTTDTPAQPPHKKQAAGPASSPSALPDLTCDLHDAAARLTAIAADHPDAVAPLALGCHAQLLMGHADPPAAIPALVRAEFARSATASDHAQNARSCLAGVLRTAVDGLGEQAPSRPLLPAGKLLQGLRAVFSARGAWQDLLLDVPLAGSFTRSFLDACRPRSLSQQEGQQYGRLYDAEDRQEAAQGGAQQEGPDKELLRTWTISSIPQDSQSTHTFSITVKKEGQVSSYLMDNMRIGRTIKFRGFDGTFTPQDALQGSLPPGGIVFLAGGIGITPIRPMFAELRGRCPITLLYCVRQLQDAVFLREFAEAAGRHPDTIRLHVLASRPQEPAKASPGQQQANGTSKGSASAQIGTHAGLGRVAPQNSTAVEDPATHGAHTRGRTFLTREALEQLPAVALHLGRLDAAYLAKAVPNLANCASFACGPPALTAAYADMLQRLDFPMDHLYQESFAF